MVAALVKGPEDENWILAEVVAYNSVTGKYDVDDIDEEQKDRHTLSKRCIRELRTLCLKIGENNIIFWGNIKNHIKLE